MMLNVHVMSVGIRKELYIWSMSSGDLVKCLDAHFARIIDIQVRWWMIDLLVSVKATKCR